MKPFIFGERNGIYIIDLGRRLLTRRLPTSSRTSPARAGTFLFRAPASAQDAIAEEAQRCGMFFVNQRWLAAC
jgi:small subunit ribosomal protein S2